MERTSLARILLLYLRGHLTTFAAFGLVTAVYALVFRLYDLPLAAVGYAGLLAGAALTAWAVGCFVLYCRKYRQLEALAQSVTISLAGLPPAAPGLEAQYQRLLQVLDQNRAAILSEKDKSYAELVDYFTLWAHQIKTPIAATDLLLQRSHGELPVELGEELAEQLFKIEQYVEMALQFLRSGEMSNDLLFKRIALDDVVKRAVHKYAKSFIRKRISLDFQELGCAVLSDAKRLTYVVEQLLSNALKYTPVGGRVRIYLAPKRRQTLVIEDNGCGIAAEDLPRVFQKGYTGYTGRVDQKSTGVGLYLCRSILARLGHGIELESAPGAGTRVFLDLSTHELAKE